MEVKRVNAMSFEEDDDFPKDANKPASAQNQQKPDTAQTPHDSNKSTSHLTGNTVKNSVQSEKPQESTPASASPAGSNQKQAVKVATSISKTNSQEKQDQKKPRKPRKTKDEQLKDLDDQEKKALLKLAQIRAKKQNISLTAKEKKEEKRKAETHCKIIAGAVAFTLYEKGEQSFTLENFKNAVQSQVEKPLELAFIDKFFKPKK